VENEKTLENEKAVENEKTEGIEHMDTEKNAGTQGESRNSQESRNTQELQNSKISKSFLSYYAETLPVPFYILLGLFVFSNMLLIICFKEPISDYIEPARMVINAILLVLCVMYIAFSLLLWQLKPLPAVIAVGLIVLVGLGWNFIGQTNEFFCTVVAIFLALLAYNRDYRVILKIVMVCHIATVLVGAAGLPLGFTELSFKVGSDDVGYSLGLIYPNHVGRMAFIIFIIAWYLWGQKKKILTLAAGVALSAVMWYVIECKTITIFLIAFPVCWIIVDFPAGRTDRKGQISYVKNSVTQSSDFQNSDFQSSDTHTANAQRSKSVVGKVFITIWNSILLTLPFLSMLLTYILGKHRLFFMQHWHFGQSLYALWMRFISAGILFDVYGFPLFGRDILNEDAPLEFNSGYLYQADIIDSAYIYYLIAIGGILLIACMLWISFGNYRALRNRDYALLLIMVFFCGYGLIEIVFFQFEHNFLVFYPLTVGAMEYKRKRDKEL